MRGFTQKVVIPALALIVLVGCAAGSAPPEATVPATAEPPVAATAEPTEPPAVTEEPTEVAPEEPAPKENTVRFQNEGETLLNVAEFDLRLLEPAQEGLAYFAWLVADNGSWTLLGELPGGAVTTFADPDGRNLLASYSGAWVSLETPGSAPTQPTLDVVQGSLPVSLLSPLRLLLAGAQTPAGLGFGPGAKAQGDVAAEHGGLAFEAASGGDFDGARQHAEHVINIIVGAHSGDEFGIAFGDYNGDGEAQNPGDGFGVWPYAQGAVEQIDIMIESPDVTDWMSENARLARQCLINLQNQSDTALTNAQAVLASGSAEEATAPAEAMMIATDAGANGLDVNDDGTIEFVEGECGAAQADELGHEIAAIVLEPAEQ